MNKAHPGRRKNKGPPLSRRAFRQSDWKRLAKSSEEDAVRRSRHRAGLPGHRPGEALTLKSGREIAGTAVPAEADKEFHDTSPCSGSHGAANVDWTGQLVDDIYIIVVRRKISGKSEVQDTKSDIGKATAPVCREEIVDKQRVTIKSHDAMRCVHRRSELFAWLCAAHNRFRRPTSHSAVASALADQTVVGVFPHFRPADVLLDLQRQAGNHPFGAGGVTAGAEAGHVVIESVEYRHFGLLAVVDPAGLPILDVDKMVLK
jgi:hypothetical protein